MFTKKCIDISGMLLFNKFEFLFYKNKSQFTSWLEKSVNHILCLQIVEWLISYDK